MVRTIASVSGAAAVIAAGLFLFGVSSRAQDSSAEDIIQGRQSNYRDLGGAYREINEEIKKNAPMKFLLEQYANQLTDLANDQENWFPKGTGPDSGTNTNAKPEIWSDPADFKKFSTELKAEAKKLAAIAGDNDKAAIAAQLKVVSVPCQGCHAKYKTKTDHDFVF
jgi:cytochrome c556